MMKIFTDIASALKFREAMLSKGHRVNMSVSPEGVKIFWEAIKKSA